MVSKNCFISDNFGQTLKDFDIVAFSSQEENILGVYFRSCIVVPDNFNDIENKFTNLTLKRPVIFYAGVREIPANRQEIEIGALDGEFKIKSVIKIEELTEDMLIFRSTVLNYLKTGRINSNVTRKFITEILEKADEEGRI